MFYEATKSITIHSKTHFKGLEAERFIHIMAANLLNIMEAHLDSDGVSIITKKGRIGLLPNHKKPTI